MIGLSGAQRTGKSTLAEAVAKKHDFPFVATSASAVFKRMGLDPKGEYPIAQRLMIQRAILEEFDYLYHKAAEKSLMWVADRTPIDLASYLMADVTRASIGGDRQLAKAIEAYISDCYKVLNRHFKVICLVQPGIKLVDEEGKAQACPIYMEHLNLIQKGLMNDRRTLDIIGRRVIPRNVTALSERIVQVEKAILMFGKELPDCAPKDATVH